MKNRVTALLLIVLVFVIMLFYQNKLQHDSEKRLKGAILSEWEERKKIEDSIRNEMDSKRSNREFIMKQDYQSELEEMLGSKLARLEEGTSAFKNNLESLVNSRLSESEERAVSFSQESEVRIKKLQEYIDQQEERRNGLESSFKQRLKVIEENQGKYITQVKYLKQAIQRLLKKQADLEKRINGYDAGRAPQ